MRDDEDALREPTSEELERAARLLAVLERRNGDGTPRYSDEEVLHFLPLVFLSVAPSAAARARLPDAVIRLLGLFADKAGIPPDGPAEDVTRALERYYEAHPVNPELLQAFQSFVREELAAGSGGGDHPFASFLEGSTAKRAPLEGGERPKGSVPGPLARLATLPEEPAGEPSVPDADDDDDETGP